MHISNYKKCVNNRDATTTRRTLPNTIQTTTLNFASNDYLGLSQHPALLEAAVEAAKLDGAGATGSRLLSGNPALFENFETEIATCKQTEAALIFNTGFQCNFSVLSSLLDSKALQGEPVVFFDKLNHASLYQAIFLTKATLIRYHHNDITHLEKLVAQNQYADRPKFIVTETVFGMDGDVAPLKEIVTLSEKYNALLYLDEAHATGLYGQNGYGLSTTLDLTNITAVIMGTFSKALGTSGAYIACHQIIKDYLINFCPGFIYSTANSPLVIGAAFEAWKLLPSLKVEREKLHMLSQYLREQCQAMDLNIGASSTNIVPIILNDEASTLKAYQTLLENEIQVSCIRPPTVPPGQSRIRIALTTSHTKNDVDKLLGVLKTL